MPQLDGSRATVVDASVLRRRWELVLPYRDEMLAVARRRLDTREDAEDVVATALLRTVEHPRLDEARIGAFLCTTVMRLAVDVHRDRARQLSIGTRDATRALPAASVDEVVCDEAEARWLAQQLRDLPHREHEVLQARLSGMTAQQASAHLGLTLKATENAYTRVRRRAERLLTATLAGIAVLLGAGRRLTRPELALVPAGVVTAVTLAVAVSLGQPPAAPASPDVALGVETRTATPVELAPEREPVAPGLAATVPAPETAPGAPAATPDQPAALPPGPAPAPARTEVAAPPVVEEHLGPGGVYVEDRHTDESFEESVHRCVDGAKSADPLTVPMADPCR